MAYLSDHEVCASMNLHEMQDVLTRRTKTPLVDAIGDGHGTVASLRPDASSGLRLRYITFGNVSDRVDTDEHDEDNLTMFIPTGGAVSVSHKGEEIDLSPVVGLMRDPRVPLIVRRGAIAGFVVPLSISDLKRHALALFGDLRGEMDIVFNPALDLTTPGGRHLRQTVSYIAGALDGPLRRVDNPIVLGGLQDLLLTSVLSLVPSSYSELLNSQPSAGILPYHVKRARDYIHASAGSSITLEMLAKQAGCSHRTLQMAFNDAFGMSPLAYVRFVRLNFVHDDLRLADDGVTVRDVALKWGFTHLGWFSKCYLEQFGVLPSQTLRGRI